MKAWIGVWALAMVQTLQAAPLFTVNEVSDPQQLPVTERSAVVVEVDSTLLTQRAAQLEVALPDGRVVSVLFDRLEPHGPHRFSWFGHLQGQPDQSMILSVVDGFYSGSLHALDAVYEFTAHGRHQLRIAELATEAFPECEGALAVEALDAGHVSPLVAPNRGDTVAFDVMVVYTPEARDGAGGTEAIEATAQAAVDAMNQSLTNSNVDAQATLSYAGLVNYNDTGDAGVDLSWLRNDSAVADLRDTYGADMVALLVNTMGGCGLGYVMRSPGPGFAGSAFQVTRRSCAVGNLSFAHEFGHNMGLEHNPEDSSATPASASFPWSFGHYHDGEYRTVMSYSAPCPNGCTRQQFFSNPLVQHNGLDTGILDERDNARSLDVTAAIIADFRTPDADSIFFSGFESQFD